MVTVECNLCFRHIPYTSLSFAFTSQFNSCLFCIGKVPYIYFYLLQHNDLCRTSHPVVGDDVDNDCDGVADDDVCIKEYGVYSSGKIENSFIRSFFSLFLIVSSPFQLLLYFIGMNNALAEFLCVES